jgi:hypothetical protein
MPYILNYGTQEQKDRILPKLIAGTSISAIAMTEPGAGSDLAVPLTSHSHILWHTRAHTVALIYIYAIQSVCAYWSGCAYYR